MNQKARIVLVMGFSIAAFMLYFWHDVAEAGRMGGGKSFGSSPSYQRSTPAPSVSPTLPSSQRPVASPAPSLMGRWGGMIGGLVMGGLVGSLLFGGGRALGGPGLLDLLLIGGGLFLLYRFIRARRMATATPVAAGSMSFDRSSPSHGWGESGYAPAAETTTSGAEQPNLPPGFDAEEFLKGAKLIYTRLQSSWDKRDMEDIRQFVSPEVLAEVKNQAQEDSRAGKTELLLINTRILEVREVGSRTVVSVFYDVMMREGGVEMAKQVREVWHFSRNTLKPEAFWLLEGIQQVE